MIRHSKKLSAGLGVVTAGLLSTGVAYAAWSSTGAGTGSAASTTSANSAIVAVAPVTGDALYPGAVLKTRVTINNPNAYPIEVTSIPASFSRAVGDPACAALTVRTDALGNGTAAIAAVGGATVIPGNTGTPATATYELTLRMSNSASDNCKSKSFTLGGSSTDGTGDITAVIRSASNTAGNGF